ncbi:MAG: outer membrane protein assembly factor BamE [Alphaproteobacteria bacterium]
MPIGPIRRSAIAAALLVAGACTPIVSQHGHLVEGDRLSEIRPGVTSKEQVREILGSPSTLSTFGDRTWYYISRRTATVAFLPKRVQEQESVAIQFDERGTVTAIRQFDLRDGRQVELVERQTPSVGKELGLMEQLIGNLGRFNTQKRGDAVTREGL